MDFHTLSRKQLQTLCKKNKIPANITNAAMADALASLNQVEGLDNIFNPTEADFGTPNVSHRTAVRSSTQRKAAREETEFSNVEQENKDANLPPPPITPAANRRRATAVSTRRKKQVDIVEEQVADKNGVQGNPSDPPKTPAVAPVSRRRATGPSVCTTKVGTTVGTSAQRAYNTRRSVRLLEKDLSKMSLVDTEDTGLSQVSTNLSHQVHDLSHTEEGDSMQIESTVVSDDTKELEGCSLENDMVVEPHGSNEIEPVKVNCLELEAEPNASDVAGSESLPVLEESSYSFELEIENKQCIGVGQNNLSEKASEDAFPEVTTCQDTAAVTDVVPDDFSGDLKNNEFVGSLLMQSECIMDDQVSNGGGDKEEKNNETREEDGPNDSKLNLEGSSDPCGKSDDAGSEVLNQDVAGYLPRSPVNVAPANIREFAESNTGDDLGIINLAAGKLAGEDYQHPLNVYEKSGAESDSMTAFEGVPELVTIPDFAGELQEEDLETKPDQFEAETEKVDASLESTSNGKESVEVQNVTIESSFSDVAATNASENLEADAQAEESEEAVAGEDNGSNPGIAFSSVLDVEAEDQKNTLENLEAEELVAKEYMVSEADNAFYSIQFPLDHQHFSVESAGSYIDGGLSCKSNNNTLVVDGDVVSEEAAITIMEQKSMTEDPIHQQKITDQLRENVTSDDLKTKSMGELKRMLKQLSLNDKPKKTNAVKDLVKKRTALQVLQQNQMTACETQLTDE